MKMKNWILLLIILFVCQFNRLSAGENRLRAMGEMYLAVPDFDRRLNLLQFGNNSAWLKANDSSGWMRYSMNSHNDWGNLQRFWDAEKSQLNVLHVSGQKHVSDNQVFYGSVKYSWNYLNNVNRAIDPQPYALDPFVLADSSRGDFDYSGPQVFAAFSHRLTESLYWGVSLDYKISRGLKEIYSTPEIICRELQASLDLAYRLNANLSIGLSFAPYTRQDITKLVKQPNGQDPQTFRYRGEYEYGWVTGQKDRTASYEGFEAGPQLAFDSRQVEAAVRSGYYYQWHELFDGEGQQTYDGYYQGEHYFINTALRFFPDQQRRTTLALGYDFRYIEDWAKEPLADLMIHRAFYRIHKSSLGLSHNLEKLPLLLAAEVRYNYYDPRKADYLAHVHRKGENDLLEFHTGFEINDGSPLHLRGGLIYQRFRENSTWHYFGDYHGPAFTAGVGYNGKQYELEFYTAYGKVQRLNQAASDSPISRDRFNAVFELKHHF